MAFKRRPNLDADGVPFPVPPDGPAAFDFRAFIATPAYDGRVLSDYALSIAETNMVSLLNGVYVTTTIMGNGAFIDIARNRFVQMFLKTNATHLFFIDADLRWEPRAFIELVRHNKPICAGAYRKRQDPEEYPIRYVPNQDGTVQTKDGWVMCDRVAAGFLCIRRDVVERMAKEAPLLYVGNDFECPKLFYEKFEKTGEGKERMIGEDFAFCDDYMRIYKEPIPVWPDFDFTHGGRFIGNWHKWLLEKSKEYDTKEEAKTSSAA
jgi:hypothetical protein